MATKERVVIYASDFTEHDVDIKNVSILRQIKHCNDELNAENVDIVQTHDVDINQPSLQKLLADIRDGQVDRIAITDLSRLSPDHEKRVQLLKELAETRVALSLVFDDFIMTVHDISSHMPFLSQMSEENPENAQQRAFTYLSHLQYLLQRQSQERKVIIWNQESDDETLH